MSATPDVVIADGTSTSVIQAHVSETTIHVAISGIAVQFGTTLD